MINFFYPIFSDFEFFLSEIFLITMFCILFVFLIIFGNSKLLKFPLVINVSIFFLLFIIFFVFLLNLNVFYINFTLFNFEIESNSFFVFLKILILICFFLCFLFYINNLNYEGSKNYEIIILFCLSVIGMLFLISSKDFLIMFLSLELTSLSFYILACSNKESSLSTEAGLKYFVLGSFSSGILLFGFCIIYGTTGLINLNDIFLLIENIKLEDDIYVNTILLGFVFIFISLLFKIGASPFHVWVPDVYEGVSIMVTSFFAIVPKISVFAFLIKIFFLFNFSFFFEIFQSILICCSILSLFIGTFGAIYQYKLKRFLAYSAISNIGYFLLSFITCNVEGLYSFLVYLLIYLVNLFIFFLILCSIRKRNNLLIVDINDLKILKETNPIMAFLFCINLFSMAGVPPLAGFYGKFYVFLNLINSEFYFLAFLGVIFSVISSFYYIRLIKILFFEYQSKKNLIKPVDFFSSILISIFSLFNLFFFVYPSFILEFFYFISLNFFLII